MTSSEVTMAVAFIIKKSFWSSLPLGISVQQTQLVVEALIYEKSFENWIPAGVELICVGILQLSVALVNQ